LTEIFVLLCQLYWKNSSFVVRLQCGHSVALILHIKHTELMLSQLALPWFERLHTDTDTALN